MAWRPIAKVSVKPDRVEAARLAYLASSKYYDLFSDDKMLLLAAVADQFAVGRSELEPTMVLSQGNTIVGVVCGFPLQELAERQQTSLKALLESFPPQTTLMQKLRAYRGLVAPVPPEGYYLSRLTTSVGHQRSGIGAALLSSFEEEARNVARVLHVECGNLAATRFYERNGYKFTPESAGFQIRTMVKQGKG